ncbi:NADH-quinone oxidoreductase subunit J family protein [Fibrella aquatilis]|uniref:NADH-quinone oxidoreductase subunit J n=1 Tax=Fibrella aquatilis TaxID=2817059 RepID=A0A939GC50_9BACT|nr:NADH-quinone oxidoreductase subunit J [Fibrella aquatilis]MBO0934529.1 NADH-quinone oxidoreductase subunit J [Fibrella aquatilis]
MLQIAFFAFIALTLIGALTVLLTRNVLYSAYALLLALLGVAALFVFAGADFLAVSQIIIYVGGVLVLVLFGVMLTSKPATTDTSTTVASERPNAVLTESRRSWLGVLLAGCLFLGLSRLLSSAHFTLFDQPMSTAPTTIDTIGKQLMTEYLVPFEVISILLLVALVGAGYLAKRNV